METTVKERLIEFLHKKNLSQAVFERQVGVSNGYVNNIRVSISPKTIQKIALYFPDLNTGWILTGEGNMLKSSKNVVSEASPIYGIQYMNVPMITIPAQAGYAKGYGDEEYVESLPTFPVIVDKNYRGKYRVFEVEGDSMDDGTRRSICNGDKILGREVKQELWKSKLHIKDWYFIICMKNDGITVKEISIHNVDNGIITCHPLNPIFDDFEVDLRDVTELYNVVKIVDRNTRI